MSKVWLLGQKSRSISRKYSLPLPRIACPQGVVMKMQYVPKPAPRSPSCPLPFPPSEPSPRSFAQKNTAPSPAIVTSALGDGLMTARHAGRKKHGENEGIGLGDILRDNEKVRVNTYTPF